MVWVTGVTSFACASGFHQLSHTCLLCPPDPTAGHCVVTVVISVSHVIVIKVWLRSGYTQILFLETAPCGGPESCRTGLIRFLARLQHGNLNQTLVSLDLVLHVLVVFINSCLGFCIIIYNNNNYYYNTTIYKAPESLASEALAAGSRGC